MKIRLKKARKPENVSQEPKTTQQKKSELKPNGRVHTKIGRKRFSSPKKDPVITYSSLFIILFGLWFLGELATFFLFSVKKEVPAKVQAQDFAFLPEASSSSADESLFKDKQLFRPSVENPTAGFGQIGLRKVSENLALLSVFIDNRGPRAIIRNTATGKTYSCSKGSYVEELMVEEISKRKVILSFGGAKIELNL
ncbi:MAG: hypothetical protein WC081_02975 [Candidatus Ratteibacteria bacterium]|jgi:hypothetical protein